MSKLLRVSWISLVISLFSGMSLAGSTYTLPNGEVLNDPTKPANWGQRQTASSPKANEPTFKLHYIVASGLEKRAMINGQKVVEGDVISGATVKKINSDSVYLFLNGKQKTLYMNKVNGIQRN